MLARWCLLPTLIALWGLPAQAAEWRVGQGGLPNIGAALERAQPGDVVRVGPGHYREHLVLDKPVSLVGTGLPTLDGGGTGDVVRVMAPDCRIQGFHVTGSGRELLGDTAAIKAEAPGVVVSDCVLDRSLYGVYLNAVQHSRIVGNTITGLVELPSGDRGEAIRLWNSSHNEIAGNRIADSRDGIYFDASPFNQVTDNTIRRVRYGLHYMYSDDNVFRGNRFTETEAGSAVMFSRRITLEGNRFSGNRGFRAYGLLIKDCENSTVVGNDVEGNRTGIYMDGTLGTQVAQNRVVGNDVGLEIRGSTEGNRFVANTIAGNTEAIATPTGIGENTWRGNYWSDYRGYDLNGDGVGDVPHKAGNVFSYLQEYLPPARLFLLSPSLQALEFAERTLPVVAVPGIEDPAPMMHPTVRLVTSGRPRDYSGGLILLSLAFLGVGLAPLFRARKAFA